MKFLTGPTPYFAGAKRPLIMFFLALSSLWLICFVANRDPSIYAMTFIGACAITLRWSDRKHMPRWLLASLIIPVALFALLIGYFLLGRAAA